MLRAAPLVAQLPSASSSEVLHYEILGVGPPTVVVLHGGPGISHDYLRPEWEALAKRARVVFYDQRGCGRSTRRGPFYWRRHIGDLDTLLARVAPDSRVILAASSWGVRLALLYALERPDRVSALVLSGTTPWMGRTRRDPWRPTWAPPEPPPGWQPADPVAWRAKMDSIAAERARVDSVLAGLRLPAPNPVDSAWVVGHSNVDPRLAGRIKDWCDLAANGAMRSLADAPEVDSLRAVLAPVLLIRGGLTPRGRDGADAVASRLRNSWLVTIPDAGHDPWMDQPERFFAEIWGFLQHRGLAGTP